MIKKLTVQNFKSIEELSLEFGRLTVFIGPNNAGKSNILDVFGFLSRHFLHTPAELSKRFIYGGDVNSDIRIELTGSFENNKTPQTYNYAVSFVNRGSWLTCGPEQFEVVSHDGAKDTFFTVKDINSNLQLTLRNDVSARFPQQLGRDQVRLGLATVIEQLGSSLPGFPDRDKVMSYLLPLYEAYRDISGYSRFNFEPSRMRSSGPVKEQVKPNELGENLPEVLHTLHSKYRRVAFDTIEEQLKAIIPEVNELVSDLEGSETSIAVREAHSKNLITSHFLPDGMLKLIGILIVLNLPEKSHFISIEEPENYIHPYAQNALADLLKAYSEENQLAITTHSPYFLNNFDLDDIVVVEREKGHTVARRPENPEHLKKLLTDAGMTTGDAWYAGHLGGVH